MSKEFLISIIDFKNKKIFKEADTYTSIFLYNTKKKENSIKYKEDYNNSYIEFSKNKIDNTRWLFYKEEKLKLNINIIKYHTPIATLRDRIFIEHSLDTNNMDIVKFFKISTIKNEEEFINKTTTILSPYKLNQSKDKYIIKKEEELANQTLEYLNANKLELLKRDKGKQDKYENWFCYGRRQGLNIYKDDTYLIIVPGMIIEDNTFFSVDINKINKPFLFSSGFIIEVDKKNKDKILTYLNSSNFKYLLKNEGKVWEGSKGKPNYYSLTMKQLKKIFK